jgi:hypothetical protein
MTTAVRISRKREFIPTIARDTWPMEVISAPTLLWSSLFRNDSLLRNDLLADAEINAVVRGVFDSYFLTWFAKRETTSIL